MEPTEQNRRAWDEAHRRRVPAIGGRPALPEAVRERLPDLNGKHVLHLQCGNGEVTAELGDVGALVTGVDVSREALELARDRAPAAAFVHAHPEELPVELRRGRFDLVFSGEDVLAFLQDLAAWARCVESSLRPGGSLFVHDTHPTALCVDGLLHWRHDYFADDAGFWRLGDVVNAVLGAGLVLTSLDELPAQRGGRRHDARLPATFLLVAGKPA